ncbi:MAG: hypothetical protein RIT05_1082 [Bacteroidota bacterium]|jgi:hypothetical protein
MNKTKIHLSLKEILEGMANGIVENTALNNLDSDKNWGNPIATADETIVVDASLKDSCNLRLIEAIRQKPKMTKRGSETGKIKVNKKYHNHKETSLEYYNETLLEYKNIFKKQKSKKYHVQKAEADVLIGNDWVIEIKLFRAAGGKNTNIYFGKQIMGLFDLYQSSAVIDIDNLSSLKPLEKDLKKAFILIAFQDKAYHSGKYRSYGYKITEYLDLLDIFIKNKFKKNIGRRFKVSRNLNWTGKKFKKGKEINFSKKVHNKLILYGWEIK